MAGNDQLTSPECVNISPCYEQSIVIVSESIAEQNNAQRSASARVSPGPHESTKLEGDSTEPMMMMTV